MKQEKLKHLKLLYKHVEYYNKMAPFPVYCSEWEISIKDKIKEMENDRTKEYDKEPVFACSHCGTLVVPNQFEVDDDGNEICQRCNSVNEVKEYKNIHEYRKQVKTRY